MSRLIDADELKKCVLKWLPQDPCGREEKEFPFETDICVSMLMEIDEQPTITPELHWIPVTERLPEKDGEYLTTWIDAQKKLCVNVFLVENGVWYWNQKYIFPNWRIIAWMPLPEPWKGEVTE